jgi:hypothetical protein
MKRAKTNSIFVREKRLPPRGSLFSFELPLAVTFLTVTVYR